MFHKSGSGEYREIIPGIRLKTLSYGDKTLLSKFLLGEGVSLPRHHHPSEQTGYLISGNILLTIGEDTFEAKEGDSWTIPSNVEHSSVAIRDTVVVEVFSPLREEYLPQ